jgi:opacity protein-like surface antigen
MDRKFLVAMFFIGASIPLSSQVVPTATEVGLPLAVGAGFSNYDVDWGHGRMDGGTLWIDYTLKRVPFLLHGIGIEAEARDISLDRGNHPANFRQDTIGGGAIYRWPHFRSFHPYGKLLVGYGSIDFANIPNEPNYKHDSRTIYAAGGGLEYSLFGHIWVRADYEYQAWPDLLGHTADPQGFTVGSSYDFGHIPAR